MAAKQSYTYIHKDIDGERGTIRRSWAVMDKELINHTMFEFHTVYEMYKQAIPKYVNNPYLGTRGLNEDGTAGPYEFNTFGEVDAQVQSVKCSLGYLGLPPRAHVAIYGKNKPEWLLVDFACHHRSNVPVPLYDTLGPEAAAYVIDHAEAEAIFCDIDVLGNAVNGALNTGGRVKFVVAFPLQPFERTPENVAQYNATLDAQKNNEFPVMSWEEFAANTVPTEDVPPAPEDLFTICYTSGTTGTPKGAMISHGNIIADMMAMLQNFPSLPTDRTISFLPLAHMYERAIQVTNLMVGASTGFYRGDTLLLLEDCQACGPTVFVGVPRLYNKIYDKIMAQVEEGGFLKQTLFNWVFERKRSYLESGSLTSYFDFVFAKVRDALGGKVRVLFTGSAPISSTVMDFLRCCLSAPVLEGYGQTEGTCCSTTSPPELQFGGGHVGGPINCNEICLMSVPDMNYTVNDVINGKHVERGEICFRGPNVFQGYWKNAEKTAETIDENGWLHSGDIGLWQPNGFLKIIDRKKNIFKLSQGEYVAPEKIENIYVQSKWVAQSYVYGNSMERFLVGIVVPDEEVLAVHCAANNIAGNFSDWCKNSSIRTMILKDMEEKAVANKLQGFERVKAIHLHDDLFAPENGILTPTFKLKRPNAKKVFGAVIEGLYAEIAQSKGQKLRSKL